MLPSHGSYFLPSNSVSVSHLFHLTCPSTHTSEFCSLIAQIPMWIRMTDFRNSGSRRSAPVGFRGHLDALSDLVQSKELCGRNSSRMFGSTREACSFLGGCVKCLDLPKTIRLMLARALLRSSSEGFGRRSSP